MPVIMSFAPQGLPRLNQVGLDYHVVLFAIGASLFTTLLFGVIPAWRATQLDVNQAVSQLQIGAAAAKPTRAPAAS